MADETEPHGPDFEVWNHLESGWQMAQDDLARHLTPDSLRFLEAIAKALVGFGERLVLPKDDPWIKEQFPEFADLDRSMLLEGYFAGYRDRKSPWLNHAVDLEIASRGIGRATMALDRFRLLAPSFAGKPIPDRARRYLAEAVATFLFGFDPACIALCRSTVEQVAKERLLAAGLYTEAQLRREQPTAAALLEKLKQAGLIRTSYDQAKRVIDRGNTVIHRHLYEDRILCREALDSLADLTDALVELLSA